MVFSLHQEQVKDQHVRFSEVKDEVVRRHIYQEWKRLMAAEQQAKGTGDTKGLTWRGNRPPVRQSPS
jgi:hypothetical protein